MISLLCPTRNRPNELRRMVDSVKATVHGYCPQIICYVDDDDCSYDEFVGYGRDVQFIHGPRIVLSNTWNKCAEQAFGDIFGQMNDDIIFRTPGWDAMVEQEFQKCPDKILVVHGSDGSNKASGEGKFGPHPFVHRKWVETLGYFTPPFFSSDYGDTWLNDLANSIERRRFLPFMIEHMHPIFDKGPEDKTHKERIERHSADLVERLYGDLAILRAIDVDKLKLVMR